MGFNGYLEQNGLVKQTSKSNSQQDPAKHQVKIMTWDSMAIRKASFS